MLVANSLLAETVSLTAHSNAFIALSPGFGDKNESEVLEVRRSYTSTGNQDKVTYLRFLVPELKTAVSQESDIESVTLALHGTNLGGD